MLERLGKYEIRGELGHGGMATVYRGFDPSVQREVAIKVMGANLEMNEEFRERFTREARVIAGLEHSSVVPLYDFGEHEGQPYLVMRLMRGGSLADRLSRGPLEPEAALPVLRRIAGALDDAHRRGIIHRDLKPANVLFSDANESFLGDFGIARLLESTMVTASSLVMGTPAYMSPEQARGRPVTPASDIYSFAAMAFEMLTGQPPFVADNPVALAVKHIYDEPERASTLRPGLPSEADDILLQGMAKTPEERFPLAVSFVDALADALRLPIPPEAVPRLPGSGGIPRPSGSVGVQRLAIPVEGVGAAGPLLLSVQAAGAIALVALALAILAPFATWEGWDRYTAWGDRTEFGRPENLRDGSFPLDGWAVTLLALAGGGAAVAVLATRSRRLLWLPAGAGGLLTVYGVLSWLSIKDFEDAMQPAEGIYFVIFLGTAAVAGSLAGAWTGLAREPWLRGLAIAGYALAILSTFFSWVAHTNHPDLWAASDQQDTRFVIGDLLGAGGRADATAVLILAAAGIATIAFERRLPAARRQLLLFAPAVLLLLLFLLEWNWFVRSESEFIGDLGSGYGGTLLGAGAWAMAFGAAVAAAALAGRDRLISMVILPPWLRAPGNPAGRTTE